MQLQVDLFENNTVEPAFPQLGARGQAGANLCWLMSSQEMMLNGIGRMSLVRVLLLGQKQVNRRVEEEGSEWGSESGEGGDGEYGDLIEILNTEVPGPRQPELPAGSQGGCTLNVIEDL